MLGQSDSVVGSWLVRRTVVSHKLLWRDGIQGILCPMMLMRPPLIVLIIIGHVQAGGGHVTE
jgi:hypothetical protein